MISIYNFLINKNNNSIIAWIVLYLLIVGTVILRVNVEVTGYRSPDSYYYLEAAQNILDGIGPYIPKVFDVDPTTGKLIPLFDQTKFGHPRNYELTYMSVWPLGYPLSIASVAYVTGFNVFWAQKW